MRRAHLWMVRAACTWAPGSRQRPLDLSTRVKSLNFKQGSQSAERGRTLEVCLGNALHTSNEGCLVKALFIHRSKIQNFRNACL
jgi:hypothetical protein